MRMLQKSAFRLRSTGRRLVGLLRKYFWISQGLQIGAGTLLPPVTMVWPHQVQLGRRCQLENNIYFKFDGIWSTGPSIVIGDDCFIGAGCEFNIRKKLIIGKGSAIASGCKFIDHDHGITGTRLDETPGAESKIELGEYVWLGCNVLVLKGVRIGDSAVVGSGAVVTKDVPSREIWGGVPARCIGKRSDELTLGLGV